MNVLVVPPAQEEFLEALDQYANAGTSLALRFKEETARCIRWIAVNHEHRQRVLDPAAGDVTLRA